MLDKQLTASIRSHGYPASADPKQINYGMTTVMLFILVLYVTMVYGPIAAMLVEMFPVANRVVSMSFAYSVAMALSGGIMPGLDSWFTNELKMPGLTMVWIGVLGVLAMVVLGGMKDTTGRDLKA